MTRGRPALWSAVFGTPLVALGLYVYRVRSEFQVANREVAASPAAGLPIAVLGLFVIGLGLYVRYVVTPAPLAMREGESKLTTRTPALRHTLAQALVGVAIVLAGGYLLFMTELPYLYPTVALAVGLYVFSTGLYRYWRNTLTRYVVTDRRVVEEYWFLSLVRNEVPFRKVRGVAERRGAWEALFGVGSVRVRSGADRSLTVDVHDVYESGDLAELLREQIGDGRPGEASVDGGVDADDGPVGDEDGAAPSEAVVDGEAASATATDASAGATDGEAAESTPEATPSDREDGRGTDPQSPDAGA